MLQTRTVAPELMELLKFVMQSEVFEDFLLVGGTSLSLQIGHRNSVDLDFFGNVEIDTELFRSELSTYGAFKILKQSKNILITNINGVKTDFVNYRYPLIADYKEIDGVRLISKQDIAAMKLNAVSGRGSKKDFIDLYFLLKEFSLSEMIEFYLQKYDDGSKFLVAKSLAYFIDAENNETPEMFTEFNWDECKNTILQEVNKL